LRSAGATGAYLRELFEKLPLAKTVIVYRLYVLNKVRQGLKPMKLPFASYRMPRPPGATISPQACSHHLLAASGAERIISALPI